MESYQYAGGAAILAFVLIIMTFMFFGAICFVADDIRWHLKKLTDAQDRESEAAIAPQNES